MKWRSKSSYIESKTIFLMETDTKNTTDNKLCTKHNSQFVLSKWRPAEQPCYAVKQISLSKYIAVFDYMQRRCLVLSKYVRIYIFLGVSWFVMNILSFPGMCHSPSVLCSVQLFLFCLFQSFSPQNCPMTWCCEGRE